MAGFDPDVFGAPTSAPKGFDTDVFGSPVPAPKMDLAKPKGSGSAIVDAGNAVGTGFFRNGVLGLAGLPVDTVANVIDLGKAALGSGYQAITGNAAPRALDPSDRKNVVGSHAWLLDKARETAPGQVLTQAVNPDYEGGYLQAAGGASMGVMRPNNWRQAINQGVTAVSGALAGKGAAEATGDAAWGVVGGLTPSAIQQGGARVGKAVIIGANPFSDKSMSAAERRVAERVTALRNAGVESPTMGLATGNRMIGGVENILQNSPGSIGVMERARQKAVDGLQANTLRAADIASTNRGTTATGEAIKQGLGEKFKGDVRTKTGNLYDVLDQHVAPQTPTLVTNTLGKLDDLTATIPGAPNVSSRFVNGTIRGLRDDFRKDTAGAPQSVMVFPQPPRAGGGVMNAPQPQPPLQVVIPQQPPTNQLPWEAVKKTRTLVGEQLGDGILATGVPDRQWRSLYGSLSEDMGNAARNTSPAAEAAFNRASNYNRAAMGRMERVAPFANAQTPERSFNMLADAANERGSLSTLQAVKKSLPQDTRGQVAGTIIERLGKATNGAQNADGTAWSPETFLTNWNKMTPKAREELFSGFKNAAEVKASVDSVAKATEMMRTNSKLWANPSGTAANLAARGTVGLGLAGGLLSPWVPAGVAAYMGGNRLAAGLLTDAEVVNSMAKRNYVSPQLLGAQGAGLLGAGLLGQ